MLTVSDFVILIKSCFIESRNSPSPKSEVLHETQSRVQCPICVIYENLEKVYDYHVLSFIITKDKKVFQ